MNKKGISDIYMLIIQTIAIGLIFSLLMFKAQEVDLDAIHRNLVAKDLGLTMTTISFLPENIRYDYLTDDNGNYAIRIKGIISAEDPIEFQHLLFQIWDAQKPDSDRDILIDINSPGGAALSGMAISKIILEWTKCGITTVITSGHRADSAAAIIFLSGKNRAMARNAVFLMHFAYDPDTEQKSGTYEIDIVNAYAVALFVKQTLLSKPEVLELMRMEFRWNYKLSVKSGIVTEK